MAIKAMVFHTDGTTSEHDFDGEEPPLEWMQEIVGGYIELVPGAPHRTIVNEDAIMMQLAVNEVATRKLGNVLGTVDGKLRGNVIVLVPVQ